MTAAIKPRLVRQEKNEKFANDGSLASVDMLLRTLAGKCFKRVEAMGLGMEFSDVLQEMYVSYIKAKSKWNAQKAEGAMFATYCTVVCYHNFNHAIARMEKQRTLGKIEPTHPGAVLWTEENAPTKELIGKVRFQRQFGVVSECEYTLEDNSGASSYMDTQPGPESESPDYRLEKSQEMRATLASLSAGGRKLISAILTHQSVSSDPLRLRTVAKSVGLEGAELKQVKQEILKTYGVTWL